MTQSPLPSVPLDEFPANSYQEWRAAAEESLKGAPFEKKLITRTHEGIDLQPIYNQSDLDALDLPENWPGLLPFLRGSRPAPDRTQPWLIAQELPYGDPVVFNEAAKADLMRGQNALNFLLDVATRRGLDPDQADGEQGEVAQCGLSIACLADLEQALEGLEIQAIPVLCWAGASAQAILGAFAALAHKRGLELRELQGGILADPITEWVRDGKLSLGLPDAYAEMAQTIRWAEETGCALRTVGVQGSLWADCGANAVEELAYALATATEYLRELVQQGIDPGSAADRFVFEFSLSADIFPQIAKLRAARLIWWKVVSAFTGENGSDHGRMFIHGRSTMLNKSTLDPHTNMLRATAEGFAGAIGGANSLHVAAFDEPLRAPDTFSRRIARNEQIILAEECGFTEPLDPSGGSWYIETLTHQMAEKAWGLFQEIERKGGMNNALRQSFPQVATAQTAAKRRAAVASRKDGLIGVNLFPNVLEKPLESPFVPFAEIATARVAAVECCRAAVAGLPVSLTDIPSVIAAWESGATLGQIVPAIPRKEKPESPIQRIRAMRLADDFESLRARARHYADTHGGQLPKVWLACFGPPKQYKARADFSTGFIAPGGFLVEGGAGAKTVEEAVTAAVAADPLAVVLCSTDETYPDLAPSFIGALREQKPDVRIILAGFPTELVPALEAAGVQDFIHLKRNCLEFNQSLQNVLGLA